MVIRDLVHADEQGNAGVAALFQILDHIQVVFVEDQHVTFAAGQG